MYLFLMIDVSGFEGLVMCPVLKLSPPAIDVAILAVLVGAFNLVDIF